MAKEKVVLAYSGGLDTSIMIRWLIETYDYEVIAVCANLGQAEELDGLEAKAKNSGASKVYVEDLQDEWVQEYIYPTLRALAIYESKYLLGTSMARPLIAKRQVEIAEKEGAQAVAHGATGKGNDQVRFEIAYMALNPDLKIVAPWKDPNWTLTSREDCEAYAAKWNIPIQRRDPKASPYSEDRNLWHISHEGLELEDPGNEAQDSVFTISKTLADANDSPEYVEIGFEEGSPCSVNGKALSPLEILQTLNKIGADHAIGQLDMVENRLVGIKSRGVYETPGGTLLYEALRQLEQLVLDRDTMRTRNQLAIQYAELVYDGKWFSPLRESLDAFFTDMQQHSTGRVRFKLYKGNIVPAGTWADRSMYIMDLASFSDTELYQQSDATGFIRLFGLPNKVNGMLNRQGTQS